jgi:hypothetical protein
MISVNTSALQGGAKSSPAPAHVQRHRQGMRATRRMKVSVPAGVDLG